LTLFVFQYRQFNENYRQTIAVHEWVNVSCMIDMHHVLLHMYFCAIKYGIDGEGDVGCWRYGLPWEVFAWSIFACEVIALYVWLGS